MYSSRAKKLFLHCFDGPYNPVMYLQVFLFEFPLYILVLGKELYMDNDVGNSSRLKLIKKWNVNNLLLNV